MKQILNRVALLGILFMAVTVQAVTQFDPPELTANGQYQVEGNWSQLKRGWNVLIVKISSPTQQPLAGLKLDIAYDMVGMPMSPPNKTIVDKKDGTYEKQVFFGMQGDWKFQFKLNDAVKADVLVRQQRVSQ